LSACTPGRARRRFVSAKSILSGSQTRALPWCENGIVVERSRHGVLLCCLRRSGCRCRSGLCVRPALSLAEILPLPCVPLSVPALLAALYFSTHSRMVSSRAGAVTANATKLAPAIAKSSFFKVILGLFTVAGSMSDGLAGFHRMSVPSGEARNPALLR
jgi:hypothetical protein